MGIRDLRTAFYSRVEQMAERPPVSWANLGVVGSAPVPRYEIQTGVNTNRPPLLNGYVRQIQEMSVRVIVEKNSGDAVSEDLIWAVVDRFALGTDVGGYRVFLQPEVQMPLIDGDEYVTPVLIALEAHRKE